MPHISLRLREYLHGHQMLTHTHPSRRFLEKVEISKILKCQYKPQPPPPWTPSTPLPPSPRAKPSPCIEHPCH